MNNQLMGLTSVEAEKLVKQFGKNENLQNQNGVFKILLRQFESPIIYLLLLTHLSQPNSNLILASSSKDLFKASKYSFDFN